MHYKIVLTMLIANKLIQMQNAWFPGATQVEKNS